MKAEITTGSFIYPDQDGAVKLSVEVDFFGDITITGYDGHKVKIEGKNVREAFWLVDALAQAAPMSQKRPLA